MKNVKDVEKNPCTFYVLVDNRSRKIGKVLSCIHIGLVRITKKNVWILWMSVGDTYVEDLQYVVPYIFF